MKLPRFATLLAWFNAVLPTELPLKVPAVRMPPLWVMLPPDTSSTVVPLTLLLNARLPAELRLTSAPASAVFTVSTPLVVFSAMLPVLPVVVSGPLTVSACASVRLKSFALNPASVPTRFAPVSVVSPTELPLKVPAVRMPPLWVMLPPDTSSTVVPLTLLLNARLPAELRLTSAPASAVFTVSTPLVVFSAMLPVLPVVVSGPLTVSACASVRLKSFALNPASVPTRLAPVSVVSPTELPLKLPAVRMPPLWVMLPPDTSSTVVPLTLPARPRSPAEIRSMSVPVSAVSTVNAPLVVVRLMLPVPPVVVSGLLTVSAWALVRLKSFALKLPSIPIRLASSRLVSPAELPVNVPAVMMPDV